MEKLKLKKSLLLAVLSIVFVLPCVSRASDETLTITTYYPSPYGVYNQLQTNSLGVGDNDGDSKLDSGDVPATAGDVWIKGNVGIGTTNPDAKVSIVGQSLILENPGSSNFAALSIAVANTNHDAFSMVSVGSTCDEAWVEYNPKLRDSGMLRTDSQLTGGLHIIAGATNSPITFSAGNSEPEIMRISGATGNVGIGTTAPQEKLDVSGNIYGWNVPRDVIITTSTHNGNFGGYQAMYNWIQTHGCSGYHVCDGTELSRYYQIHPDAFAGGWFNDTQNWTGECTAWTISGGTWNGAVWDPAAGNRGNCGDNHPVMCCK